MGSHENLCTVTGTTPQLIEWGKTFTNSTSDKIIMYKIYKQVKEVDIKNKVILKGRTDLNSKFSNEDSQMTEKHLKKCSTSLATREIQMNTTLRFHLSPVRMAKNNKISDSSC